MKKSNFVVEINNFPLKEINFWYSTITNKATILSQNICDKIDKGVTDFSKEEKVIIQKLKSNMFLLDDDFDELAWNKYNYQRTNFYNETLGITLIPTMNCNLNCIYCFEGKNKVCKSMTDEKAQQVLKWIEKKANNTSLKKLQIQYFGGEPTQRMDLIEYFSKHINKLGEDKNLVVESSIITNGVFSRKVIDKLIDLKIKSVHFTIDGSKEFQDIRKPQTDGGSTFDTVYENFKYAVENNDKFEEIMLRINLDTGMFSSVEELLNKVKDDGLAQYTTIDINGTYWDKSTKEYNNDINEKVLQLTKEAVNLGFKFDFHIGNFDSCNFSKINNVIIGYDGTVYKCLCLIGEDIVSAGTIEDYDRNSKMFNIVTQDVNKNCLKCVYSPLCYGGCKAMNYLKNGNIDKGLCRRVYFDKYIKEYLKIYYGIILEKKCRQKVNV